MGLVEQGIKKNEGATLGIGLGRVSYKTGRS